MHSQQMRSILAAALIGLLPALGWAGEAPATPGQGPDSVAAPLRLVLNVPAFRLDVYTEGELLRSYPVAVGQPDHQTPRGSFEISRVVWNPWWRPPNSEWAQGKEPARPTDPSNPMGEVKLYFTGLYFIHGSPRENSRLHPASHGCVRMSNEDAIQLARLVHRYASPDVTPAEITWLLEHPSRTKTIRLASPVPLRIEYDLVEVFRRQVQIHPDIYDIVDGGLVQRAVAELIDAGYHASAIDRDRIEELAWSAQWNGHTVRASMQSLIDARATVASRGGEPLSATRAQ